MIYDIYVKKIDKSIDEETTIIVNGIKIVCFYMGKINIKVGKKYKADFELINLDDFNVKDNVAKEKFLKRNGNTFGYIVAGQVTKNDTIDVGIKMKSDYLGEYEYLIGKYIEISVDRIVLNIH